MNVCMKCARDDGEASYGGVEEVEVNENRSGSSANPVLLKVVWCGVVWCGVVWCGVVWCGAVWCGVVWCGVVWWW